MKIQERIFNSETGETVDIERQETPDEKIAREKGQLEYAQRQAEAAVKATARQALLNKLGITAEEAQLLLGGN